MIKARVFGSGSSGNCYLIDDGQTQLIIEAGVAYSRIEELMGFDFSRLAGVLISHEHGDHPKYLKQLMKHVASCAYGTAGTWEALNVSSYQYQVVKQLEPINIGSWKVIPFDVKHDAAEPVDFLLENQLGERFLYVTDTYFVKYKFKHVKYMFVEMNYSKEIADQNVHDNILNAGLRDRILTSHFEMENSLNFIKANQSPETEWVTLIHLSDTNSNETQFKRRTQELTGIPVYVASKRAW